jgi:CRP-like cAMP-binding protein
VDPRFQHETNEGLNAEVTNKTPSPSEKRFISEAISNNVLFKDLAARELDELISKMKHHVYAANSEIFKEGDAGKYFYIVITGRLEMIIKG